MKQTLENDHQTCTNTTQTTVFGAVTVPASSHICDGLHCTVIGKIIRTEAKLSSIYQKCIKCNQTNLHVNFETKNATLCTDCSPYCDYCGGSPFSTAACAFDHDQHTFDHQTNEIGVLHSKSRLCDQCRSIEKRCMNKRKACRCNSFNKNHHCPQHSQIKNHVVTFTGDNKICDTCTKERLLLKRSKPTTNQQRLENVISEGRSLDGASMPVIPKKDASMFERVDWYKAYNHLFAVVQHLKQKEPNILPLSPTNMQNLYDEKSKIFGGNTKYGLPRSEVVKRMFQWFLGKGKKRAKRDKNKTITHDTTLKTLPWDDPRFLRL
jgi:hypothetical protein